MSASELSLTKEEKYRQALESIHALLADETDLIVAMSSVAYVIRRRFRHFNWVGFYRRTAPSVLKVGPYLGDALGCLTISTDRGVCGQCAREKAMQLHNDVAKLKDHIACDPDTEAEIVFPIIDRHGELRAVFDIDSTVRNCFDDTDVHALQQIATLIGDKFY